MLSIVQTAVLVVAALVSAYAVAASEASRRLDGQRARVERLRDAMLALAEVAIRMQQGAEGLGASLEVAKRRLTAELEQVGIAGFESTELMVRPSWTADAIADQSRAAIIELAQRLNELAPRPLLAALLRR